MNEKVVYMTPCKKYIIVYGEAIFLNGFNVYKHIRKDIWKKFNPEMQFFNSLENAKSWLFKKIK